MEIDRGFSGYEDLVEAPDTWMLKAVSPGKNGLQLALSPCSSNFPENTTKAMLTKA